MPLKLMYITNNPAMGKVALSCGVDRLFVDMETIAKRDRQRGRDTAVNHHTVADVASMRACVDGFLAEHPDASTAELLVRCNPWQGTAYSRAEVEDVLCAGADAVMLPYFKTVSEADGFLDAVSGRARTVLLLETPEAVAVLDDILALGGIDEMYIGLNDLSIGYGRRFLFELLADGTVESLCRRMRRANIPYGFGGVAAMGEGVLPAEYVVAEHYRLRSSSVILSRSFTSSADPRDLPALFSDRVRRMREWEAMCMGRSERFYERNAARVRAVVAGICGAFPPVFVGKGTGGGA